ncbi:WavE lipopolysaccharide synthesis family protein [Ursidibacter arcticus]
MDLRDITIVFQGAFNAHLGEDRFNFKENLRLIRKILPGVKVILSTWENTYVPENLNIDKIVFNKDPGGLAGIKHKEIDKANNINRQIITTFNGLKEVKTTYAVKLRTDCRLEHAGFIDYFKKFNKDSCILSTCFFTIDPTMYEHMPFHISDWFQFGKTEDLLSYWNVPLMEKEFATWYQSNPYSENSGYFDKEFLAKFAVEQYIASNYANQFGYETPKYHNDNRKEVLESHNKFLAEKIIILDPWQIGLYFPKYHWAYDSKFSSMNCIMFLDWYKNYIEYNKLIGDSGLLAAANSRAAKKEKLRKLINFVEPYSGFWYQSKLRRFVIKLAVKFTKFL